MPPPSMKRRRVVLSRHQLLQRLQGRLVADGFPRLQMSLLVGLTGGFGLLASYGMLQAGLGSMALRYPLALGFAYLFFLLLLWMWLRWRGEDVGDMAADLVGQTLSSPAEGSGCASSSAFRSGEGGEFAGGGASGDFDHATTTQWAFESPSSALTESPSGTVIGEAAAAVGDADELVIPLMAVLLTAGLALAVFYVVYIAPMLMAELLVDGALSYVLFRRLRHEDRRHWLGSALRHTWLPFVLTGVFLWAVGAGLALYAPEAKSIGDVLRP